MATGDEHEVKGKLEQVKGAVKEGFGALTGDRSTEIEGKAERAKGAIREGFGKAKNDLTGANDDELKKP
jgi:uncharacterized protein YjbJ (UPF0337 family)